MKILQLLLIGMLSLLVACSSGSSTDTGSGTDADTGSVSDTDAGSVTNTDTDSNTGDGDVSGIDDSGIGVDGSGIDCGSSGCNILAAGPIDAFGSVIVGEVTYEIPQNVPIQVCSGRETITSEGLSLGMYIELSGIKNQDGVTGTVDQINVCPILCGTIESPPEDNGVNASEKLLTLLGKTVLVRTAETVLEEGRTFEALSQGDQICVYGYSLAEELLLGTRVEYQQDESILFVATISEILGDSNQFVMSNGLTVLIDGATETTFTNGLAAVGLRVEIIGALNSTMVTAASIREDASPLSSELQPDQTLILEGAIDITPTDNSLSVEGITVELPDSSVLTPSFFNLETGLQLRIESQNAASVLSARSIFIKRIEEEGRVTAIDATNRTMTVELRRFGQSIAFNIDDNTQIIDSSNGVLTFTQLTVGDEVAVLLALRQGQLDQDQQYFAINIDQISEFIGASSSDPVALNIITTRNIDATVSAESPLESQSVVMSSTGVLNLIINSAEQYGSLVSLDSMTLAGTLQVTLNGAFTPAAGDSFRLLEWDPDETLPDRDLALVGTFENVLLSSLPDGLAWDMSNLYSEGEIRVMQAPGGINVSPDFWIDASDVGIDYVQDNEVFRWIDKSGNNRNLDAPDNTRRPVFNATSINSRPGIVFTDDSLSDRDNDDFWSNLGDYTILFVSRQGVDSMPDTGSTGVYFLTRHTCCAFTGLSTSTVWFTEETLVLATTDAVESRRLGFTATNMSWQADDDILFTVTASASNGTRLFKDGTQAIFDLENLATSATRISPADAGSSNQDFMIGSNEITADWDSNYTLSEMLVYDGELSDDDRRAVEAYLADKYNLIIE